MEKNKDNIKSIIFVAWFIFTIIFGIAFQGNVRLELFIFGQAFFIFGIIGIFSMDDISREEYILFLFILVGFTLIEISIVEIIKPEYINRMLPSIITNSGVLFGLLILMFEKKKKIKPKKRKLYDFKTRKTGLIKMYQRSYRYNVRNLNLIKNNWKSNINLIINVEQIKVEKDNFARNIGIFFIVFSLFIRLLFI